MSMPMSDEELLERLQANPAIRSRMEVLLLAVGDKKGEFGDADTAKMRLIDEMRRMGHASLSAWAQRKAVRETERCLGSRSTWREGKKLSWHTTFGEVSLEEVQLRTGNQRIRPFVDGTKVHHRGVSRPLQRVVTDFVADVPFAQAMDKLVEHYGVLLDESVIRRITLGHARKMHEASELLEAWPDARGAERLIAEMGGGMVPIMEPDAAQPDQRKGKRLSWKVAKIGLAHPSGSRTIVFGGTVQGDATAAGRILFDCARRAGFGRDSHLHAVGDGASWIATQVDERFGAQGRYLVDFYHVCDYLGAAAKDIVTNDADVKSWMEEQKMCLKRGEAQTVLESLHPYLEPAILDDSQAPVRCCHRYLSQRLDQLYYHQALAQELPIGSGEIESTHRYLVQQRLKRPGAWWRAQNAEYMLALRLNQANRQWHPYWSNESKQAA